ncbi:glutamine amidotransferase, class I [Legionella lansingensis]|uniref:Glutamine amidotransferase, class I n=1 Tax=Legionella lansingensis TaxID=45067 RepID=A0A0W0VJC0_9GAMM|nr:glutamine amidotransferase [Legionella lansingensis]KTD20208.1 glutamine amidotransferase, class I [Legionella lansingensis]SNV48352.1 glutamine amidotransferase, class I [Legionella lansingensis]
MNIGILQCDEIHEKFIPEHGRYQDMFAKLFHEIDRSLTFVVYDAKHGELPSHTDEADAYLITGSRHGVNDDFPWITNLEEFIRQLHQVQKKVIGVCFGHQLIAKALGGKVIKSPNGWGIGMSINKIIQKKNWMIPAQDNLNLLVSHQDQVIEPPKEAEILAQSDFCPFYMMQINENLFTIQGHPEYSKAYTQAIIEDRKIILGEERSEQGLTSLQLDEHNHLIAKWMVNFLYG